MPRRRSHRGPCAHAIRHNGESEHVVCVCAHEREELVDWNDPPCIVQLGCAQAGDFCLALVRDLRDEWNHDRISEAARRVVLKDPCTLARDLRAWRYWCPSGEFSCCEQREAFKASMAPRRGSPRPCRTTHAAGVGDSAAAFASTADSARTVAAPAQALEPGGKLDRPTPAASAKRSAGAQ